MRGQHLDVIGCRQCDRSPFEERGSAVACRSCGIEWPVGPHGTINALNPARPSALQEIDGMRAEHPGRYPTRESFILEEVDHLRPFGEMITCTLDWPTNYGFSVMLNFERAFDLLPLTGKERVLEIGAEHDFPFLRKFRERGCDCYATNLYLRYERDRHPGAKVVLGDMNQLPYRNSMFDVVVMSATSHHSPDLSELMVELARVVKPDGHVVIINDPTHGLFKHAPGSKKGGDRHHDVHENEYSAAAYMRTARRAGFDVAESFFSVYYDMKLRSGKVAGVRHSGIAKVVAYLWRYEWLRQSLLKVALFPGQMLLGLDLNMVLRKRSNGRL